MQSVGTGASNVLAEFGPELAAVLRTAQNNEKYAQSVRKAWADNPEAAEYLLAHTNIMFFEKDQAPRKGPGSDKDRYNLCVYVDDSLANSELNARRELLVLMLAQEGIHFQSLVIRFATKDAKERHLFPELVEKLHSHARSNRKEMPAQREACLLYTSHLFTPSIVLEPSSIPAPKSRSEAESPGPQTHRGSHAASMQLSRGPHTALALISRGSRAALARCSSGSRAAVEGERPPYRAKRSFTLAGLVWARCCSMR